MLGRGEEVQGSQAVGQAGRTQPDLCSSALSSHMPLSHLKNNRHQRLLGEQAAGPFTSLSLGHLPVERAQQRLRERQLVARLAAVGSSTDADRLLASWSCGARKSSSPTALVL